MKRGEKLENELNDRQLGFCGDQGTKTLAYVQTQYTEETNTKTMGKKMNRGIKELMNSRHEEKRKMEMREGKIVPNGEKMFQRVKKEESGLEEGPGKASSGKMKNWRVRKWQE